MKTTGIIRRIDELGRIVIPKEIRKNLRIKNGESLEIYLENDSIILKKYSQIESLKNVSIDYVEAFNQIIKHNIIVTDRDKVIAATGPLKKNIWIRKLMSLLRDLLKEEIIFLRNRRSLFRLLMMRKRLGIILFLLLLIMVML